MSTTRLRPRLEGLEGRVVLSTLPRQHDARHVAVNLKTGKDATGHISLRSAIMAADAKGGSNTINLPGGTFKLTIAGANEDASATGDLDITGNLTIRVRGGRTVVDGNNLDRVIEVLSGKVSISELTVQNGRVTGVGGRVHQQRRPGGARRGGPMSRPAGTLRRCGRPGRWPVRGSRR